MTELLEKAFRAAADLPEAEQNQVAGWLLAEIESERRWSRAFEGSQDELSKLADQALDEVDHGETEALDPSSL